MKTSTIILTIFLLILSACTKKGKGDASPDGLERARNDITAFKAELKSRSPEQLIISFLPAENPKKYGGYEYYYKSMANNAIIEELSSRGKEAVDALRMHVKDNTFMYEAINGPGETVGGVCKNLLDKIKKGAEQGIPADAVHEQRGRCR
jgi:hypothetical protein